MGYNGSEGLFALRGELRKITPPGAQLPDLVNLSSYTGHALTGLFSHVLDINASDLAQCGPVGPAETRRMNNYVAWTGDRDGVVPQQDGALIASCLGNWWLSPACRDVPDRCIPALVAADRQGLDAVMMKAALHVLPVAVAAAVDEVRFASLPLLHRILIYCWTPDLTFLDKGPERVVFPAHNATEWSAGKMGTASAEIPLSKWAHRNFGALAHEAHALARNMEISARSLREMLLSIKVVGTTPAEAACEWLRRNAPTWRKWAATAISSPAEYVIPKVQVHGSFGFQMLGIVLSSAQASRAARSALALSLEVLEEVVNATATESRRLRLRGATASMSSSSTAMRLAPPRRLAGSWRVTYTVEVSITHLPRVQHLTRSIKRSPVGFGRVLRRRLDMESSFIGNRTLRQAFVMGDFDMLVVPSSTGDTAAGGNDPATAALGGGGSASDDGNISKVDEGDIEGASVTSYHANEVLALCGGVGTGLLAFALFAAGGICYWRRRKRLLAKQPLRLNAVLPQAAVGAPVPDDPVLVVAAAASVPTVCRAVTCTTSVPGNTVGGPLWLSDFDRSQN